MSIIDELTEEGEDEQRTAGAEPGGAVEAET